jgi:hypothetical protein
MITESPHVSRQAFLEQVDGLIIELEEARAHFQAQRAPGLH